MQRGQRADQGLQLLQDHRKLLGNDDSSRRIVHCMPKTIHRAYDSGDFTHSLDSAGVLRFSTECKQKFIRGFGRHFGFTNLIPP